MNGAAAPRTTKTNKLSTRLILELARLKRTIDDMNTLKQAPIREVTTRYGRVVDGIYRDTVAPFGVRRTEYLACCKFSNEVEKFGVKSSAIAALPNGNKGFRLSLQSESGTEFEVEIRDGMAKLGAVKPHQPRQLLASGSASTEAIWTRFAEVIRQKEGK
jgi:hypothetical protein